MALIRLFVATLLFLAVAPGLALAQEPVTLTGQVNDGGVTRTITLTVVFTPVQVSTYEPVYTTTLTTGNVFALGRSASYGEIIAGAAGVVSLLVCLFAVVLGVVNGRNG